MQETALEALIHLVQDTYAIWKVQPQLADAAIQLEDFRSSRLMPAWHREQRSRKSPYVLSLVGLTNVGKSTLMEAILGYPVAPHKMGPATAIPVEYEYGSEWCLTLIYRSSKYSERQRFPSAELLADKLRAKVIEPKIHEATELLWITVSGPMKLLDQGLKLVDTPGFGAAEIGSAVQEENTDDSSQQQLVEFIDKHVDRVYYCVAAGSELTISECQSNFFKKIQPLCGHVLITKWEENSNAAKKEYQDTYSPLFPGAEFVFVNAKRRELDEFKKLISEYASPDRRLAMCTHELVSAWHAIEIYMERMHGLIPIPWSEIALQRFLNAAGDILETH